MAYCDRSVLNSARGAVFEWVLPSAKPTGDVEQTVLELNSEGAALGDLLR